MSATLEIAHLDEMKPQNAFLQCELAEGHDPYETALEVPLFDFAKTQHQMGARLVSIPPGRAFARHTHPNAYHFIYVLKGTGILEYDGKTYTLKPNETCLVSKGVTHKLGTNEDGLLAMIVNTPTYDNGDPAHVHYLEEETLESVEA
jgi:quercetin dioxygenase-like cupin family protein